MKKISLILIILLLIVFVGCDNEGKTADKTPTPKPTEAKTATPVVTSVPTPTPTATPDIGANVALGKDYEVSSFTENTRRGWLPECINDGIIEATDGVHMGWTSLVGKYVGSFNEDEVCEWVMIDLGKEYNINTVKAWPRQDETEGGLYFPVDYQIDVSDDKENWTTVYEKKDDNGAENFDTDPRVISLTDVKGRYVRFMATKLTRINASYQDNGLLMQLAELEIFSKDQ